MRGRLSSDADVLPDGTRVEENSELTYYLNVKYDGIDRQGVVSSDAVTAEVSTNTMQVSDKIPEGLTFLDFVTNSVSTIGAVKRSDGITPCPGNVIDDTGNRTGWINNNTEYVWHGLHYIKSENAVRFKVQNLQAGCQLAIGIKTKVPNLSGGQDRMDFYNTAAYLEGDLSGKSNTTHHFIGRDTVAKYRVVYQYTGTVPDGVPSVPATAEYPVGQVVGLEASPMVKGYDFSGWTTSDVTVTDGSFEMPARTVTMTSDMFADCINITNISPIAGWDMSSVTNIDKMFMGAYSIADLQPLNVWNIDSSTGMAYEFDGIPASVLRPTWYHD